LGAAEDGVVRLSTPRGFVSAGGGHFQIAGKDIEDARHIGGALYIGNDRAAR